MLAEAGLDEAAIAALRAKVEGLDRALWAAPLLGIGAAFDTPARQAFVNEMVPREQLANAVGLNSASFNLARMVEEQTHDLRLAMQQAEAALPKGADHTAMFTYVKQVLNEPANLEFYFCPDQADDLRFGNCKERGKYTPSVLIGGRML